MGIGFLFPLLQPLVLFRQNGKDFLVLLWLTKGIDQSQCQRNIGDGSNGQSRSANSEAHLFLGERKTDAALACTGHEARRQVWSEASDATSTR